MRISGDARLYDVTSQDRRLDRIELKSAADGRAYVFVEMKPDSRLVVDAYAVDTNGRLLGERTTFDSKAFTNEHSVLNEHDRRATSDITFYTGTVIDTFAGSDVTSRLDTGGTKVKPVFGIDFTHRLVRTPRWNLWIGGETVHGARSAEVDCAKLSPEDQKKANCSTITPPSASDAIGILRASDSLEGFASLRFEPRITQLAENDAILYFRLQAGFLSVPAVSDNFFGQHHLGVGVMKTRGVFRDSYIEFAIARADIFRHNNKKRAFADGYISYDPKGNTAKPSSITPFLEFVVDSDLRGGADSAQIYAGLNFDFQELHLFGKD